MPMSPEALDDDVLAVAAVAALWLLLVLLLLLPQGASTNAPKLAAPALPASFRKRLRSTLSRARRSTMPAGCGACSSDELNTWAPPVDDLSSGHGLLELLRCVVAPSFAAVRREPALGSPRAHAPSRAEGERRREKPTRRPAKICQAARVRRLGFSRCVSR